MFFTFLFSRAKTQQSGVLLLLDSRDTAPLSRNRLQAEVEPWFEL